MSIMVSRQASSLLQSLALVCLACITGAHALLVPDKHSFSLRSSVRLIGNDGSTRIVYLQESYSREQNRATFHFETNLRTRGENSSGEPSGSGQPFGRGEKRHSVYVDLHGSTHSFTYVDRLKSECKLIDRGTFDYILNLNHYPPVDSELKDPLILGAARLLFFDRDQFKRIELGGESSARNIPTVAYEHEYQSKDGRRIQMRAIYAKNSMENDQQASPIQIILDQSFASDPLVVDFGHIQLLSSGINPSHQEDDVELDEFAIRPDLDCPKSLVAKGKRVELFEGAKADRVKFTFLANNRFSPTCTQEMFVAYDARVHSLRVDFWNQKRIHSDRQVEIFNFALNRRYDIRVKEFDRSAANMLDAKEEDAYVSAQCLVGRLRTIDDADYSENKRLSLGNLLAGASRFVYQGRARVRGLDAKLYEAEEGVLMPYWLDQSVPIKYMYRAGESVRSDARSPARLADMTVRKLKILLYATDQTSSDLPIPLKLEIFEANLHATKMSLSHSWSIHSFSWHLGADGAFGERASELFSLVDTCAAGSAGASSFARVHLLLEAEGQSEHKRATDKQPTALELNSALLGALQQQLHLPANLVLELQSRVRDNIMDVSFRVADHLSSYVQPFYLGQGRCGGQYSGRTTWSRELNFYRCLMQAAHHHSDLYFGYDPLTHDCVIDLDSHLSLSTDHQTDPVAPNKLELTWPGSFLPDTRSQVEIYGVKHIRESSEQRTRNWMLENIRAVKNHRFVGEKLRLLDYPAGGDSELTIRRSSIDKQDSPPPLADGLPSVSASRIVGYTFVDGARGNRKISAEHLATDQWAEEESSANNPSTTTQMTIDKCHAVCLSDFDCRSYSACVRSGQFECILSRVNFSSGEMIEKFQLELKKSPKSERLQLNIGDQQFELLRSRLCTIHIKRYLEMFSVSSTARRSFKDPLVHQVRSREDCAQLCIDQTLGILKKEVAAAERMPTIPGDNAEYVYELVNVATKYHRAAAQVCRAFFYLDRVDIAEQATETELRNPVLDQEVENELSGGYCLLAGEPPGNDLQVIQNRSRFIDPLDWQVFSFEFELLYERQFGVSLARSEMTKSDADGYRLLTEDDGSRLTEEQRIFIREFITEGRNVQIIMYQQQALDCVRYCFLQTLNPWQPCRSFDVVIRLSPNSSRVGFAECHLNSVTLAQVIASGQSELIKRREETTGAIDIQVWHFEPRAGLTLESSLLGANIEPAEHSSADTTPITSNIHLSVALLFALLGMVSGVLISFQFGSKAIELITPVDVRRRSEELESVVGDDQESGPANCSANERIEMQQTSD